MLKISRKAFLGSALAAGFLAAGGLSGAATDAKAQEFTWNLQTIAGAGTNEYAELPQRFVGLVDDLTDGRVKINLFPAGQLMRSGEVPAAVSSGTLEMGHTYLVYFSGREPALRSVNEWPALVDSMQGVMWFYERGGHEIMREILARHNMYFLGVTALLGEHIWSKSPLRGVADLRGLKMRAAGLAADSFNLLGASVVTLSGEEVYQALQRGIVDAAEFTTLPVNYGFGFHEITDYIATPTYSGGGTYDWIVHMDAWNRLPDEVKLRVDQALQIASYEFSRSSQIEEATLLRELADVHGMTIIEWSQEDVLALEKSRIDAMRGFARDSETYARILESQLEFLEVLGYNVPD